MVLMKERELPKSHYSSVLGHQMHYYDEGTGDPILFLHGIPTSAYLWRNIIPVLSPCARCVAPDLIGMGKSDKPDIKYTLSDHVAYLDAFIEKLALKNITLVVHGWGSVIGLDYARRYSKNIKAIAFYESFIHPVTDWNDLSLPIQQLATLLKRPRACYRAVIEQNYFVEKILPRSVIRQLTETEMKHYREPFQKPESRQLIWQHITEMPFFEKGDSKVMKIVQKYSDYLQTTAIPKLMLYAVPGFITTMGSVIWCKENLPNVELACLDDALHLAQESMPEQFSSVLLNWYRGIA
jgi:haloalkane dehalogenase